MILSNLPPKFNLQADNHMKNKIKEENRIKIAEQYAREEEGQEERQEEEPQPAPGSSGGGPPGGELGKLLRDAKERAKGGVSPENKKRIEELRNELGSTQRPREDRFAPIKEIFELIDENFLVRFNVILKDTNKLKENRKNIEDTIYNTCKKFMTDKGFVVNEAKEPGETEEGTEDQGSPEQGEEPSAEEKEKDYSTLGKRINKEGEIFYIVSTSGKKYWGQLIEINEGRGNYFESKVINFDMMRDFNKKISRDEKKKLGKEDIKNFIDKNGTPLNLNRTEFEEAYTGGRIVFVDNIAKLIDDYKESITSMGYKELSKRGLVEGNTVAFVDSNFTMRYGKILEFSPGKVKMSYQSVDQQGKIVASETNYTPAQFFNLVKASLVAINPEDDLIIPVKGRGRQTGIRYSKFSGLGRNKKSKYSKKKHISIMKKDAINKVNEDLNKIFKTLEINKKDILAGFDYEKFSWFDNEKTGKINIDFSGIKLSDVDVGHDVPLETEDNPEIEKLKIESRELEEKINKLTKEQSLLADLKKKIDSASDEEKPRILEEFRNSNQEINYVPAKDIDSDINSAIALYESSIENLSNAKARVDSEIRGGSVIQRDQSMRKNDPKYKDPKAKKYVTPEEWNQELADINKKYKDIMKDKTKIRPISGALKGLQKVLNTDSTSRIYDTKVLTEIPTKIMDDIHRLNDPINKIENRRRKEIATKYKDKFVKNNNAIEEYDKQMADHGAMLKKNQDGSLITNEEGVPETEALNPFDATGAGFSAEVPEGKRGERYYADGTVGIPYKDEEGKVVGYVDKDTYNKANKEGMPIQEEDFISEDKMPKRRYYKYMRDDNGNIIKDDLGFKKYEEIDVEEAMDIMQKGPENSGGPMAPGDAQENPQNITIERKAPERKRIDEEKSSGIKIERGIKLADIYGRDSTVVLDSFKIESKGKSLVYEARPINEHQYVGIHKKLKDLKIDPEEYYYVTKSPGRLDGMFKTGGHVCKKEYWEKIKNAYSGSSYNTEYLNRELWESSINTYLNKYYDDKHNISRWDPEESETPGVLDRYNEIYGFLADRYEGYGMGAIMALSKFLAYPNKWAVKIVDGEESGYFVQADDFYDRIKSKNRGDILDNIKLNKLSLKNIKKINMISTKEVSVVSSSSLSTATSYNIDSFLDKLNENSHSFYILSLDSLGEKRDEKEEKRPPLLEGEISVGEIKDVGSIELNKIAKNLFKVDLNKKENKKLRDKYKKLKEDEDLWDMTVDSEPLYEAFGGKLPTTDEILSLIARYSNYSARSEKDRDYMGINEDTVNFYKNRIKGVKKTIESMKYPENRKVLANPPNKEGWITSVGVIYDAVSDWAEGENGWDIKKTSSSFGISSGDVISIGAGIRTLIDTIVKSVFHNWDLSDVQKDMVDKELPKVIMSYIKREENISKHFKENTTEFIVAIRSIVMNKIKSKLEFQLSKHNNIRKYIEANKDKVENICEKYGDVLSSDYFLSSTMSVYNPPSVVGAVADKRFYDEMIRDRYENIPIKNTEKMNIYDKSERDYVINKLWEILPHNSKKIGTKEYFDEITSVFAGGDDLESITYSMLGYRKKYDDPRESKKELEKVFATLPQSKYLRDIALKYFGRGTSRQVDDELDRILDEAENKVYEGILPEKKKSIGELLKKVRSTKTVDDLGRITMIFKIIDEDISEQFNNYLKSVQGGIEDKIREKTRNGELKKEEEEQNVVEEYNSYANKIRAAFIERMSGVFDPQERNRDRKIFIENEKIIYRNISSRKMKDVNRIISFTDHPHKLQENMDLCVVREERGSEEFCKSVIDRVCAFIPNLQGREYERVEEILSNYKNVAELVKRLNSIASGIPRSELDVSFTLTVDNVLAIKKGSVVIASGEDIGIDNGERGRHLLIDRAVRDSGEATSPILSGTISIADLFPGENANAVPGMIKKSLVDVIISNIRVNTSIKILGKRYKVTSVCDNNHAINSCLILQDEKDREVGILFEDLILGIAGKKIVPMDMHFSNKIREVVNWREIFNRIKKENLGVGNNISNMFSISLNLFEENENKEGPKYKKDSKLNVVLSGKADGMYAVANSFSGEGKPKTFIDDRGTKVDTVNMNSKLLYYTFPYEVLNTSSISNTKKVKRVEREEQDFLDDNLKKFLEIKNKYSNKINALVSRISSYDNILKVDFVYDVKTEEGYDLSIPMSGLYGEQDSGEPTDVLCWISGAINIDTRQAIDMAKAGELDIHIIGDIEGKEVRRSTEVDLRDLRSIESSTLSNDAIFPDISKYDSYSEELRDAARTLDSFREKETLLQFVYAGGEYDVFIYNGYYVRSGVVSLLKARFHVTTKNIFVRPKGDSISRENAVYIPLNRFLLFMVGRSYRKIGNKTVPVNIVVDEKEVVQINLVSQSSKKYINTESHII